ncbi:MAG: ATP-binding cassette subfamily B protein, partial [Flavobacteriaceae bacterium]
PKQMKELKKKEKISFKAVWKYYWEAMKDVKWLLSLSLLVYCIYITLGSVIVPIYYKRIIDFLSINNPSNNIFSDIIDLFIPLILLLFLVKISSIIGDYALAYSQSKSKKNISNNVFKKILFHSQRFFNNEFVGSLVSKVERLRDSLEIAQDRFIFNFYFNAVKLVGIFIVLFSISTTIGWFFFVWIIIYLILIRYFVLKKMQYDFISAQKSSKLTGKLADVLSNIFTVKIFSHTDKEKNEYEEYTVEEKEARDKAWYFNINIMTISGILFILLEIGGMYFALKAWSQGLMSTGTVVLIQLYWASIFGGLLHLAQGISRFMKAIASAKEMVDILEQPIEILDPEHPQNMKVTQGSLSFDNVSFAYHENNEDIINNFSLSISGGEKIGLVGPSGGGKSTITKLILRFMDVTSGSISIDGIDIGAVAQDDLRRHVSYVPQEPLLFHRTIRENIAYGKDNATDEEIQKAAEMAYADEFIQKLPKGYDTLVGERGVKLSGGERQRVAIARAFLENAPILVLDEATSSLDSESEQYIQKALDVLMEGKTTLIIAHRLSTIQKMDRILVLKDGNIVEDDTHENLVQSGGIYSELWNHQTSGFIE